MSASAEASTDVKRAAVIGAGTMGTGIAQVLAAAGIDVTLVESDAAALERAGKILQARLRSRILLFSPLEAEDGRCAAVGNVNAVGCLLASRALKSSGFGNAG